MAITLSQVSSAFMKPLVNATNMFTAYANTLATSSSITVTGTISFPATATFTNPERESMTPKRDGVYWAGPKWDAPICKAKNTEMQFGVVACKECHQYIKPSNGDRAIIIAGYAANNYENEYFHLNCAFEACFGGMLPSRPEFLLTPQEMHA